ncbi:MAG TPA: mannitol dehydrogenase family protein [Acidimicrobiales bacterium]|nr:mannitol dehydrogenase family protein [Acidimicrobiales bacterium]
MSLSLLARTGHPEWTAAPARIVHLGLGGFFRAHAAWYTAHADDADDWGIVGFSGHSHDLVDRLAGQDGLYTLTTRGNDRDTIEVVPSVVEVHPGTDTAAWRSALASPEVTVVTLTVTEAAYAPGPSSVAARLVDGLVARRRADAGPVTLVPCDNIADNASTLADAIRTTAARLGGVDLGDRAHGEIGRGDVGLVEWIDSSVRVVGTVVDRITPRPTPADEAAAAALGYVDAAPVVTEPFSEWIISGTFAADRPDWESAGAQFVDDLAPYARRKLHLLNGAHSLLAYAGLLRGHTEVANALADDGLADALRAWWDEAAPVVGGADDAQAAYRRALMRRFANPRMHHALAQIAIDGATKLPVRVIPVARAELAAGRSADAAAMILGAWVTYVRREGANLVDARRDEVLAAAVGPLRDATHRLITLLAPDLADHDDFVGVAFDASESRASYP